MSDDRYLGSVEAVLTELDRSIDVARDVRPVSDFNRGYIMAIGYLDQVLSNLRDELAVPSAQPQFPGTEVTGGRLCEIDGPAAGGPGDEPAQRWDDPELDGPRWCTCGHRLYMHGERGQTRCERCGCEEMPVCQSCDRQIFLAPDSGWIHVALGVTHAAEPNPDEFPIAVAPSLSVEQPEPADDPDARIGEIYGRMMDARLADPAPAQAADGWSMAAPPAPVLSLPPETPVEQPEPADPKPAPFDALAGIGDEITRIAGEWVDDIEHWKAEAMKAAAAPVLPLPDGRRWVLLDTALEAIDRLWPNDFGKTVGQGACEDWLTEEAVAHPLPDGRGEPMVPLEKAENVIIEKFSGTGCVPVALAALRAAVTLPTGDDPTSEPLPTEPKCGLCGHQPHDGELCSFWVGRTSDAHICGCSTTQKEI